MFPYQVFPLFRLLSLHLHLQDYCFLKLWEVVFLQFLMLLGFEKHSSFHHILGLCCKILPVFHHLKELLRPAVSVLPLHLKLDFYFLRLRQSSLLHLELKRYLNLRTDYLMYCYFLQLYLL